MKVCLALIAMMLFSQNATAKTEAQARASGHVWYRVGEGQGIGRILQAAWLSPLWGKTGYVQKTIELNIGVLTSNGNFVEERAIIILPVSSLEAHPNFSVTADRELRIHRFIDKYGKAEAIQKLVLEDVKKSEPVVEPVVEPVTAVREPASEIIELPPSPEEVEKEPKENFTRFGTLSIAPRFSFLRVDSKDAQTGAAATLLSEPLWGFEAQWGQIWSPRTSSFLYLQYTKLAFEKPGLKTIQDAPTSRARFGFGIRRQLSTHFGSAVSFGYGHELFARAISTSIIAIDRIALPRGALDFDYNFGDLRPFNILLRAGVYSVLGGKHDSFNIKLGYGARAGALIIQQLSPKLSLMGGMTYSQNLQDSTISKQKTAEGTVFMGIHYRLF